MHVKGQLTKISYEQRNWIYWTN